MNSSSLQPSQVYTVTMRGCMTIDRSNIWEYKYLLSKQCLGATDARKRFASKEPEAKSEEATAISSLVFGLVTLGSVNRLNRV